MKVKNGIESIKRFDRCGYKTIHLVGNWYLVRKYSKNARRFSLYGLARI